MKITPKTIRRFLSKVKKTSKCWIWQACIHHSGYGIFQIEGKVYTAHRVSYQIFKGSIPDGISVLHSCDNPNCVNPKHLRAGTHQDNMNDKVLRNRQSRTTGETNGMSFLTEDKVRLIRQLYKNGKHGIQAQLSRQFKVSPEHIHQIVTKKRWKHLED